MEYEYISEELELRYGVWTNGSGMKIYIQNMTNSYIKNCINRLHKSKSSGEKVDDRWLNRFYHELSMRDVDMSEGWRLNYN